jgi:cell division protease FtsH
MAYSMISIFGMNEKVGNVSFYGLSQDQFTKPYSDGTASMIDEEVRKLVEEQYKRAQELLLEHRDKLEILANALLEKEMIVKSDVERLIGPRPYAEVEERPHPEGAAQSDDEDVEAEVKRPKSEGGPAKTL